MISQNTFLRNSAPTHSRSLTADLHVSPDFSGRVLVYVRNGLVTVRRLADNEHLLTLTGFIEMARQAGWVVTPPEDVTEVCASGTNSNPDS
ncbi:hypothetical protein [Citrobacter koseri]|uniref:hypothetical protein n=1 Tax=Citrobacter koseri TaxID=545 RepID=UPI0024B74F7B|nr:hypothetical protein [Citrobacter koseri]MDI9801339.1 hypothetical protein [Citrobacter koseri]